MEYKHGDVVIYKKRSSSYKPPVDILCTYDCHLDGQLHVVVNGSGEIDFCWLEDLTPYIEENKQGKHYLERFDDE